MPNQFLPTRLLKAPQMPLQICSRHLTPPPDRARAHLLRHPARHELEQVRPLCVNPGYEQPYAIRALAVVLRVLLGFGADAVRYAAYGERAAVLEARGEALGFHEVAQDAPVGAEARQSDAHVGVDGDYLFLVGGEFFGVSLCGRREGG